MNFESRPDLPTPLNSWGGYGNGAGSFEDRRSLTRKVNSRKDLSQPKRELLEELEQQEQKPQLSDDATDRYFGAFSIESKRHVWDLLRKHPEFGQEDSGIRMNRIRNNTREVLPNDPIKIIQNGGFTIYEQP